MRRHRLVFFLGLYLACVAGLYLFVGVRDSGHGARLVARLALPAVELGLCALLCALFLRLARRGPRWPWLVACWAVAALAAVVYAAQVYSLYLSRNFISVLALENADSVAFVASPTLLAAAFVALAWLALFCVASRLSLRDPAGAVGAERWGWPRFGAQRESAAASRRRRLGFGRRLRRRQRLGDEVDELGRWNRDHVNGSQPGEHRAITARGSRRPRQPAGRGQHVARGRA